MFMVLKMAGILGSFVMSLDQISRLHYIHFNLNLIYFQTLKSFRKYWIVFFFFRLSFLDTIKKITAALVVSMDFIDNVIEEIRFICKLFFDSIGSGINC